MPKHVHFFKAASRLGLIHPPIHSETPNIGVEQGPDAVLTHEFLRQIDSNYSLSHFVYPTPEEATEETYLDIVARSSGEFARQIVDHLKPQHTQVVVGGDHSVAYASMLALYERLPVTTTVGYIQFDSHADMHRADTSPTGNFHGMWVRALTEGIGHPAIDAQATRRLDLHSAIIYGNLETEAEEERYLTAMQVDRWSASTIQSDMQFAVEHLRAFVSHYDHIHVSFDVDVFDREHVSATGTPAQSGLHPDLVFPLLQVLSHVPSLSIDLVEVNPTKSDAQQTVAIAQRTIEALLAI